MSSTRYFYAWRLRRRLPWGSLPQGPQLAGLALAVLLWLAFIFHAFSDRIWALALPSAKALALPSAKALALSSAPAQPSPLALPASFETASEPSVFRALAETSFKRAARLRKASAFIHARFQIADEAADYIAQETFQAAQDHSLDPALLFAVIAVESRFNPISQSSAGALGLTQALPRAHPEKISSLTESRGHILSIRDNVRLGAKILAEYMAKHKNDPMLALQQYNGSLFDKSRAYSKKVMALRERFHQAISS